MIIERLKTVHNFSKKTVNLNYILFTAIYIYRYWDWTIDSVEWGRVTIEGKKSQKLCE